MSFCLCLLFRWLPKTVMRPLGPDAHPHSDCVLVVGISRPRVTALFLSLMLVSLFFTFHVLYDRAVYSTQIPAASQIIELSDTRTPFSKLEDSNSISISHPMIKGGSSSSTNQLATKKDIKDPFHFLKTGRRLPKALIVGVRKCGTRALLEMLYLHPQIQKASGEVHFFDRDENYDKGLDWYRKKMPYSFRGQITIEKSPSYFVTPEVPERVRAMNASIKLMIIVRDPVTRAISDYTQLKSHAATAAIPSPGVSSPVNK